MHVTSKMMTGHFSANFEQDPSALFKRYLLTKPALDMDVEAKIVARATTPQKDEQKFAILRQQLIAHHVQTTELIIGMGAIKEPDMSAFSVIWRAVSEEMAQRGYSVAEPMQIVMVEQVVRTLVVLKAVCAAVLSETNHELRVDVQTGEPKRFEDHYQEHLKNIERLLVAELPEILFGISLCADVFGTLPNQPDAQLRRSSDLKNILRQQMVHCDTLSSAFVTQQATSSSSSSSLWLY